AAAIFARAHAGGEGSDNGALIRTVLLPLLTTVAEHCGGFDWNDEVFDRAYGELERSLFGSRRAYAAVAPLIGLGAGSQIELGRGIRVRVAAAGGPVLFERLDWRPYGIRPVLPIAATQPPGEPSRLDSFRGNLAGELLERISTADEDPELAEALDRWELSLFATEPFRSEQLREALTALLGGADGLWAATVRTALLLGETARDRADHLERLRALVAGEPAKPSTLDALRRALVEP